MIDCKKNTEVKRNINPGEKNTQTKYWKEDTKPFLPTLLNYRLQLLLLKCEWNKIKYNHNYYFIIYKKNKSLSIYIL